MAVIARQLGHADTRMTEKHLAPNYVAQTIRENFPVLGIANAAQVIQLSSRRGQSLEDSSKTGATGANPPLVGRRVLDLVNSGHSPSPSSSRYGWLQPHQSPPSRADRSSRQRSLRKKRSFSRHT